MGGVKRTVFKPNAARHKVYLELYTLYRELHDAFGTKDWTGQPLQRHEGPARPPGPPKEITGMLADLKESVWKANLDLARSGLVMLTFGNVSGIDRRRGIVAIKPSGVPYDDAEGRRTSSSSTSKGGVVEGWLSPSSDTPTHLELYKAFPEIGGVAHAHSAYATMFAQARREIPCLGTTHADHFHGPVPLTRLLVEAEVAAGYERNTGRVIVERFAGLDPLALPAVLVAGHGPFTWGRTPAEAIENGPRPRARWPRWPSARWPSIRGSPPLDACIQDKHFQQKTRARRLLRTEEGERHMTNIPKVRLGLVAVSRDCFPIELSAQALAPRRRGMPEGRADRSPEIQTVVENEKDVLQALEELRAKKVNALVIYLGNFGPEGPTTILAQKFDGPVMFAAAAEESGKDLINGRGDAYCGMLNTSYNIGLRKLRPYIPEYPVGHARGGRGDDRRLRARRPGHPGPGQAEDLLLRPAAAGLPRLQRARSSRSTTSASRSWRTASSTSTTSSARPRATPRSRPSPRDMAKELGAGQRLSRTS